MAHWQLCPLATAAGVAADSSSALAGPVPRRLDDHVNSPDDEYLPHLSPDGRRLTFTSNRPGGLDWEGRAGLHREDLWESEWQPEGGWSPAALLAGAVNTPQPEGSVSVRADGREMVFGACDRATGLSGCDLYLSSLTENGWSAGVPLAALNGPGWDSQPALSADGRLLIFASDRPGGLGGSDLWLSARDSLDAFGPPLNLGAPVNSSGNEAGPFLHLDGSSLYFSSDGHGGLGGLDLFFSRRGEAGSWSEPVNLGPPLSTEHPDLGLCVAADGRRAVFSSRRGGRPDLDLYETRLPDCCPAQPVLLLGGNEGQEAVTLKPAPLRPGESVTLGALRFDLDRSELRPEGLPLLQQLAELLAARPELRIELRGHTDDQGDAHHNLELSLRRAQAVKDWLAAAGIDPARIEANGAGNREPLFPGRDEAARAANRRTELRVH